jgi:putative SOS response-associated peptidase YedK
MCNEYARELEAGRIIRLMEEMKDRPPFAWQSGRIPNDQSPAESIKIRDAGLVVRLRSKTLVGEMLTWGWKTPRGKPVFNFISEGRDFSESDRVLILATSFYEYTEPKTAKVRLKDKHRFTLKGHSWFWIAGIVKQDCFTMLTTKPGPDMIPYHDRQICVLPPAQAIAWLGPDQRNGILETPPAGTFAVKTMRKNGEALA